MLNNINNDEHILNNSISQQAKIAGIDKKSASVNPYSKVAEFGDVIDISDQARKLYEKEQDVQKFKSMVMDSLDSPQDPEQLNTIMDSIKSGDFISNDAIAEKMLKGDLNLNGSDLLKILLAHPEIANTD
jgi:hypothetical protein